jgi:heavy metal sensor kinase
VNTRSLKFQLIAWYAGLLTGGLTLLGIVTYVALENSLVGSLKENQLRRSRQVAQLVREEIQNQSLPRAGQEVETRYAPEVNDRFFRISQQDGVLLYVSRAPKDQSFDPASLPPPKWPQETENARQVSLLGGRKMLITGHTLHMPGGANYLVETGAPMDEVHSDLRKWLTFLALMLPVTALLALGGGYILVKRALLPVDQIASSAERITSLNLSDRLPVPHTGDELERLSLALNHMIERIEGSFQQTQRFVEDASHELRTPLTVLRGELESMAQDPQLAPDLREQVGSVHEEVLRLTNIVEGLFAISRLDAGDAANEWLPFDLSQLVCSTADQMGLLAEDKNITVTCDATLGVWVEGDRSRIKQVVVNLLDNAIKYTPAGGLVTLTVKQENSKAVFEVVDNGIGIPPAALPRVFDRFYRVDSARSRAQGGAGLGLSIVKSICTAHHGRVEASSNPGQGSRFRVELPLVSSPAVKSDLKSVHEHREPQFH